jgi:hypothetical protein
MNIRRDHQHLSGLINLAILALMIGAFSAHGQTGTWTPLKNPAPVAGVPMLLTDGSVMVQYNGGNAWYRLTPDSTGSYINGTWSQLASMHDTRQYFASVVLKDGRVLVGGGEYGSGKSSVEIYDPVQNAWSYASSWMTGLSGNISDSTAKVLPDGRVILLTWYGGYWIYNPANDGWTHGSSTKSSNDEQSVALLPDGSLFVPWDAASLRYVPSLDQWVSSATPPNSLIDSTSEIGPAVLLYDGRVFCLGATGNTDFYTPPTTPTGPGTWLAGPIIPNNLKSDDAPAAVMSNGNVLVAADVGGQKGPTSILEYDAVANTYTNVGGGATWAGNQFRMLTLPSGDVLVCNGNSISIYTPAGSPNAAWRPTISNITHNADGSYTVKGTQLNGLTEGGYFGDDAQNSTNYPIVRLVSGSTVYYAKSYNFSTMGLATGSASVSADFMISGIPNGTYSLSVVANGVASNPVPFSFVDRAAPIITSVRTAAGTVGVAFSYSIRANQSPTSYTATGLPPGLTLNTSTGVISGTPSTTGTFNATISASNAAGTGSATLVITIDAAPVITVRAAASPSTAAIGQNITFTVSASDFDGDPLLYSWANGTGGHTLFGFSSATQVFSYASAGSYTVTVTVADGHGNTVSSSVTVTINASVEAPVITSASTAGGTVGGAFNYAITASSSPTGYNATGLPAGLSVNTSTGVISGTPTVAGTFNVTISATNASGTGSATLTLTINNAAPVITSAASAAPNPAAIGQSVSCSVAASDSDGDALTYSWAFGDGATASGASTTHAFSAAGNYTATATISDGHGNTVSSSVTVTVNAVSSTGPVLYWKLDDTSGTVASDSSGNGFTGTVANGGTWTAGKINGALSLNGANQNVLSTNNLSSQFSGGSVTIALWFKANAAGVVVDELGQQTLNSGWHDSQIEVLSDGSVYARVWNLSAVLLGKVTFGQWTHVALRYDKSAQKLDGFLNGVQSAGSVSGSKQWPGSLYYALGAGDSTNVGTGAFFNGALDDFRVYNRALTAAEVAALVGSSSTAVTFIKTDTTTQGNWKGSYGADGAAIENDSTNYPAYATVAFTNAIAYSGWASSTSDARAPLKYASSTDRIASCWYNNPSYSIDVNLTDGQSHQVALYCLDWDTNARAQTFTIADAGTGTVLDGPRSLRNFNGGAFEVWNIKGHVKITLNCTAGYNAVVSALFFGGGSTSAGDTVWVEDSIPTGGVPAGDGGDNWNWISSNPAPFSGTLSNQSTISSGEHQHYFYGASQRLTVNTGESLMAYVYIDPANVPGQIMLQWNNGNWEHRAYWGANNIAWGSNGSLSRFYMGALPAAGQWVRLEVPASAVGLEGSTLNGMSFTLYGGRAAWDYAGKSLVTPNGAVSSTAPASPDSNIANNAPTGGPAGPAGPIDLGNVKVNKPFKLKLPLPSALAGAVKLRPVATGLPTGVRISTGLVGGHPKQIGTNFFTVQFTAQLFSARAHGKRVVTTVHATQEYALTVVQ